MFLLVAITAGLTYGGIAHSLDPAKCNINDQDVDKCVLKALNSIKLEPSNQIKLPFVIPIFHAMQETAMANYTATMRNYTILGMNDFDVKDVRFDRTNLIFSGTVKYQPLTITSIYEIEGSVLSIPMSGDGIADAVLGPINANVTVHGQIIKHKNIRYYNPTEIKIQLIADDVVVYFDGLFGLNEELERITNEALNKNPKLLLVALTPVMESVSEKVFLKSIKAISKKILYVEENTNL